MDTDLVKITLDLQECRYLKQHFTGGRPYADRISVAFLGRLLMRGNEQIEIMSAIDQLEGLPSRCRTKKAERLKGSILGRFWHKHFFTSRHVIWNFGEEWKLRENGNRKFDRLLRKVARKHGSEPSTWPAIIAYEVVIGGLQRRANDHALTGDWIILGKHNGCNYYLDLAAHSEAGEPQRLYEKLRLGSEAEFPFLFF
jgi:hypothetical protein